MQADAAGRFCDVLPFVYPHLGATAMREARLACAGARAVVDPLLVSVALHDGLAEGDFLVTADAQGRARAKAARQFLARLNALQTLALTWGPAPSMFASVASALSHDAHECLLCVEVLVPTGLDRIGPDLSLALTAFPCAEELVIRTERAPDWYWTDDVLGGTLSIDPLAFSRFGPIAASLLWLTLDLQTRTCIGVFQALLPLANSLIGLDVYTNKLAVDALPHVAQLTGLAALTLRGNRGYDGMSNVAEELSQLSRLTSLRKLSLQMAGPYNETGKLSAKDVLDALAPMTWLRSIDVHPTRTFGGDIKAALRRLPALKELSFGGAYARKGDEGWELCVTDRLGEPAQFGHFMAGLQAHGGIGKMFGRPLYISFYDDYATDEWEALGAELARVPGGVSLCVPPLPGVHAPVQRLAMADAFFRSCAANVHELVLSTEIEKLLQYEFTTLHCICLGGTHNVRSLCRLRAPALASVELSAAVLWGSPPADAVFLAVEVLALTRPPPDGGAPLVITVPADLLSDAQLEALRASVDAHDRTGRVTFQR